MAAKKKSPHRGPSKAGKTQVVVLLTDDELEAIDALADKWLRSRTQQVRWLIREALGKSPQA